MPIFTSGRTWNYLGYRTVWRPVVYGATPDISDPAFALDSTLDPRGLFPSGMLPSKSFSYRFYQSVDDQTTSDSMTDVMNSFEQLTGAMGAPSLIFASVLPSVVFSHHTLYDAVTAFEGRDVIDLPTDGLEYKDNVLYVPSKVYRPLHAGTDKFLKEGQSLSRQSIISFSQPTSDNLVVAMKISENAPADVKKLAQYGADRRLVDVLSNGIICKSKPDYVSYVAVDKPLFRDVVVLTGSSQAIGLVSPGLGGFNITDTSTTGPFKSRLYRFALVDVSEKEDVVSYAWRLSETFGVKPTKVIEAPKALVSSSSREDQVRNVADDSAMHYAYDLNDKGDEPTFFDFNVSKTAYEPILARAAGKSTSKYYDPTKSFKVIDYELGYAAGSGITEALGVGIGSNGRGVHVDFLYTSPKWSQPIASTARLGTEYMAFRPYGTGIITPTFGPSMKNSSMVLASTTTVATGMAAINDCCLYSCTLFDMFASTSGDMIVQRDFDDVLWKNKDREIPRPLTKNQTSQSGAGGVSTSYNLETDFLAGEAPYRSEGRPAIIPVQVQINCGMSAGKGAVNVTIPSDHFVTSIMIEFSTTSNDVSIDSKITFYSDSDGEGDIVFELDFGKVKLPDASNPTAMVGVPGIVFKSYVSYGVELANFGVVPADVTEGSESLSPLFGIGRRNPILPDMTSPTITTTGSKDELAALKEASRVQLLYVKAESFPIEASGITAATDCTAGRIYLAYENKGRIDMAVRYGCVSPFSIVRDVSLRAVSKEEQEKALQDASKATADSGTPFPGASVPFLVADESTKTVFIFYLYKAKICCKRCPKELFNDVVLPSTDDPVKWEKSKEGDAALALQVLGADMVYDGLKKDAGQTKANDASRDIELGALRVPSDPSESSGQPVTQYCAFQSKQGYLFVVIQAEKSNLIRRSANSGRTWEDAVPSDFSFIPPLGTGQISTEKKIVNGKVTEVPIKPNSYKPVASKEQEEEQPAVAESPYCLYDDATNAVTIFFTFRSSLMYVKYPVDTFMKKDFESYQFRPKVLFGRYTTEMEDRGMTPVLIEQRVVSGSIVNGVSKTSSGTSSIDRGAGAPRIPAQRVAAIKTNEGYYRVFFKDEDSKLYSLISFDAAETWWWPEAPESNSYFNDMVAAPSV